MLRSTILAFVTLAVAVCSLDNARNDWNKPCLDGECSYVYPSSAPSTGTVKIWGSKTAISDVTPAAGWEVLGCSPDELSQEVRLVCTDEETESCAHLFNGGGAVDKIVRLPESCGQGPFARVAKATVSGDQSIPAHIAPKVRRRDGQQPQVHTLTLDTNYHEASPNSEPVYFSITGDNTNAASTVSREHARRWDINKSQTLPPLDINKSVNLVNQAVSCGPVTAGLKVDVGANVHAVVTVGVAATGSVIPPKITSFALSGSFTSQTKGSMNLHSNVGGIIDSGRKVIVQPIGIPGFSVPGILTVGPSVEIDAQFTGTFDGPVDMATGLNWDIQKATFVFPPISKISSSATVKILDTPVNLAALSSTGKHEIHHITRLNFGISALGGKGKSNIFVDLDTSSSTAFSANGCFEVDAGLDIHTGADGNFLGLFNPGTHQALYSKAYQLAKQCAAGTTTPSKRSVAVPARPYPIIPRGHAGQQIPAFSLDRRALTCPKAGVGAAQSLINQVIPSSAAKPL